MTVLYRYDTGACTAYAQVDIILYKLITKFAIFITGSGAKRNFSGQADPKPDSLKQVP